MANNSMERGATCQVRCEAYRIRLFSAHHVMSRRRNNSASIYKLHVIMLVLKGMTRFIFRNYLVLFFSLYFFYYTMDKLSCTAATGEPKDIRKKFENLKTPA